MDGVRWRDYENILYKPVQSGNRPSAERQPHTASYHIKQLFMRLDAHERSEALQKILAG